MRGRALTCLASAAGSESSEVTDAVKRSVFFQTVTDPLVAPPTSDPSADLVILQMVRRRTTDEKVGVRKAALQALESLMRLNPDITRKEDVGVVYERCLDPALSVRKQAIVSLTMLTVERRDCSMLHRLVHKQENFSESFPFQDYNNYNVLSNHSNFVISFLFQFREEI